MPKIVLTFQDVVDILAQYFLEMGVEVGEAEFDKDMEMSDEFVWMDFLKFNITKNNGNEWVSLSDLKL